MTNLAVKFAPVVEPVDNNTIISFDYIKSLKGSKKNWLDKNFSEVINSITDFLRKLNNSI